MLNLLYASHANRSHSTSDNQDPTNPLTSKHYESVKDLILAPELVDVSGRNLSTNNDAIIDDIKNWKPVASLYGSQEIKSSVSSHAMALDNIY